MSGSRPSLFGTRPDPRRCAPRRQHGQALVPALIFLIVGSASLYLAFNALQLTNAKMKLQNTADASAYAAAVLQARDYNFSAYTNRAMVANQAAVAQMVGMQSFIEMLNGLPSAAGASWTGNFDTWADNVRFSNSLIQTVRARWVRNLPNQVLATDTVIRALSQAQQDYHDATLLHVPALVQAVATANQAGTRVSGGSLRDPESSRDVALWRAFTSRFVPTAGTTDRFAAVATDSATLDAFSRQRTVSPAGRGTLPPQCYQSTGELAWGGTQLRPDRRGWQAIDASRMLASSSTCTLPPEEPEEPVDPENPVEGQPPKPPWVPPRPIWNRQAASSAGNGNLMRYESWRGYGGYLNFGYPSNSPGNVPSPMSNQYRNGPARQMGNLGGLQPYQDMTRQGRTDAAPAITIEVVHTLSSPSPEFGMPGSRRAEPGEPETDTTLHAIAAGQAYFTRPAEPAQAGRFGLLRNTLAWARGDRKTEYPSLFSPYWEARLVATDALASPPAGDRR